jgi:hypothetical protein
MPKTMRRPGARTGKAAGVEADGGLAERHGEAADSPA